MKSKYARARILLILYVILAASAYPTLFAQDVSSQSASIGQGVATYPSEISDEKLETTEQEPPLGYEIDVSMLQELKASPYTPSDYIPTNEEDKEPASEFQSSEDAAGASSELQALAPNLLQNWEGPDNLQPDGKVVKPPDPHIAAGLSHIGVAVNCEFAFYTKSGALAMEKSYSSWFSNVYTGPSLIFDPRIIYDHHENRWLLVALIVEGSPTFQSSYLLSVSMSSNPLGGWWNYRLSGLLTYGGVLTWADYPDLGYDGIPSGSGGAIYITSNQFAFVGGFRTSLINVLPKSILYVGGGGTYYMLWGRTNNDGSQAFTFRTAWTYGNPGKEYLVNTKSGGWDKVTLWNIVPNFPAAPTMTRQATITIGAYSPPPNAVQKGGPATLDTIDNRLYQCVYRNGHVYTAFTEAYNWGSGTVAAIRYLKLNTIANTPSINARYGADGKYCWFPAMTVDMCDNIMMVYAHSSSTEYAGIRYTGRLTTDTAMQTSAVLKAGQLYSTNGRWGDYFGVARDPSENSKVWIYGEWAKDCPGLDSSWEWGTWVGQVSFWPSGHAPIMGLRLSPFADVLHVHFDGRIVHGTINYDGMNSHDGGYHNGPLLAYLAPGNKFYLFIDWLKWDDGTGTGMYELGMIIGDTLTGKGTLYRTTDGTSWVGPTAIALVPASWAKPNEEGPFSLSRALLSEEGPDSAALSEVNPNGGVWPPQFHLKMNPYIDVAHIGFSPYASGFIINGQQDASSYVDQPVIGAWPIFSGTNFYMTVDFTKTTTGGPIFYELGMTVGSVSTGSGSLYRTTDGFSFTGPTSVNFELQ
jgi:hypothetical protein